MPRRRPDPRPIATAQSVQTAYLEWTRQSRTGMRQLGDMHSITTYQHTTTFRIHEPIVLPGIFQTETYIRRMLSFWYTFLNAPDDTDATVKMKNLPRRRRRRTCRGRGGWSRDVEPGQERLTVDRALLGVFAASALACAGEGSAAFVNPGVGWLQQVGHDFTVSRAVLAG